MISLLAAIAHHNVIGKDNALPWYVSADLRRFRKLTTGHTVIAGRKTFESILARIGKPLPNRTNIVVTRNRTFKAPDAIVVHSVEDAIAAGGDDEIFVIGGAEMYLQALSLAQRIYMTELDVEIEGDTYFPTLGPEWHEVSREAHEPNELSPYPYAFVIYEKR